MTHRPAAQALFAAFIAALALLPRTAPADPEPAPPPARGLFVAVGYGGFRGWSVDGEHWTAERWSDKNADDPNIIFSLAYRKGIFLCSGGGVGKGFILRSTDGKHWDEVVRQPWRITGVLALSDRFFSVFDDHFQSSDDGLKWAPQAEAKPKAPGGGSGYFRRWASGNGAIVFAGDYAMGSQPRVGWIGGTRNGDTPMTCEKQSADVRGLVFDGKRFVACTHDGNILASTDGLHFTSVAATGDTHDDNSLKLFQGLIYLRGHKGVQSSTDGEHWSPVEHSPHIPSALSLSGVAIDHGWGGIQFAPDGKTFRKASVPIDPTGICAAAWGVPQAEIHDKEGVSEKRSIP